MAKWITGYQDEIVCREVHGTRQESFNAITGNPIFKVRLEVRYVDLKKAISRLLGGPARWPHPTTYFSPVVAVAAELASDQGSYTTDGDGQIVNYDNNVFIDVTYMPRIGAYINKIADQQTNAVYSFYWEDRVEPRYETVPLNHNLYFWGEKVGTPTPANPDKKTLAPDESPIIPVPGQTLVHTIEGWFYNTVNFQDYIGTVNNKLYYLPTTGQTYEAGTLLLRSVNVDYSYSFNSFKEAGYYSPPLINPGGKPTLTLRMIYEYKPEKQGKWETFFRNNIAESSGGGDPIIDTGILLHTRA